MRDSMRTTLNQASRRVLGHDIPAQISVEIDGRRNRIVMIGPMASGKTRIAQAVPAQHRQGWRCYTGVRPDDLHREWGR